MKLFLHIRIKEGFPDFTSKVREWLADHFSEAQYFDVDNQSEQLVVKTAQQAIDESDRVFVWVENEGGSVGGLLSLFKYLAKAGKEGSTLFIAYDHHHPMLEKLERGFRSPWEKMDFPGLTGSIKNFFTS